jgi:hypothetical protein
VLIDRAGHMFFHYPANSHGSYFTVLSVFVVRSASVTPYWMRNAGHGVGSLVRKPSPERNMPGEVSAIGRSAQPGRSQRTAGELVGDTERADPTLWRKFRRVAMNVVIALAQIDPTPGTVISRGQVASSRTMPSEPGARVVFGAQRPARPQHRQGHLFQHRLAGHELADAAPRTGPCSPRRHSIRTRAGWFGCSARHAIQGLFVGLFLEAHKTPVHEIILDLDATDDRLHGHQEGRFFQWLL